MYQTIQEIRAANRAAGRHWFDPETMRFFRSRVGSRVYGGRYFISSEGQFFGGSRRYTIRECLPDGTIETVGEFREFPTRDTAMRAVAKLVREGVPAE